MEKMFGQMMQGVFGKDKEKMKERMKEMAALCPCMKMDDMSEEERNALLEKMKSCCGNMAEKASAFFKEMEATAKEMRPSGKTGGCCG